LDEVYSVIAAAKKLVGGRALILECENTPQLINLYKAHNFKELKVLRSDDLVTMYQHIK
jgi:hypothetical protein